jgi:DNA-binding IclR family transcriptional regulator
MSTPDFESQIMAQFRNYRVGAGEMLFFESGLAKSHPPEFQRAIKALVEKGWVVAERRSGAYSLTRQGLAAARSSAAKS